MATDTTTESASATHTIPESTFRPYRLTVDQYERMSSAGIFSEKEPIFLWTGRLVEKIRETASTSSPPPKTFPPHRVTVDRYLRMVETGIFSAKEPIFLWHGRLVEKMSKGFPHSFALITLARLLDRLLPEGWHVRQEAPVALNDDSMPEPDISVARGTSRDYLTRHPTSPDVAMLVEVADSSLGVDSGEVLQTYAREGILVYWLVNIPASRVEVYTEPLRAHEPRGYRQCRHFGPGEAIPVILDGHEVGRVAVDEFLP